MLTGPGTTKGITSEKNQISNHFILIGSGPLKLGNRCQRQPSTNHIQLQIQDFPLGGGCRAIGGGHRPPTHVLFSKNVCENERIGSHWGGAHTSGAPWIRQ